MKRLFLAVLVAAATLPLQAQKPRAKDFTETCDSLSQRWLRRSGVLSYFKVDKALVRGNTVDLYFSQNVTAFPWRSGDPEWFRAQVESLSRSARRGYKLGKIYAGKQPFSALPMPELKADGQSLPTSFRVKDPRGSAPALVSGSDRWPLGLSGRHIALWQSHGYYYEAENDRWEWQRSPNHRTLEDIFTQSYVVPFLMPMLENAGAVVLCPRERDIQTREVVCDNDEPFSGPRGEIVRRRGRYSETGRWTDAGTGFADAKEVYAFGDNPFTMGSARKTDAVTSDKADAPRAVWRPDIPEKGEYAVYVSYKSLPASTTDARYTVHHLGGEKLLHVNQQMSGGTWVYLGTYLFDKGTDGYVELSARSSSAGIVSADAVRFGGGMGKMERGGHISGMPSFVEGALYQLQYAGIDSTLFDDWDDDYTKDYAGRGAWVQEMVSRKVPVDLSLAWHTDAGVTPNDSIIGTLAIYTRTNKGLSQFPDGEDRMNSRLYSDLVQTQVVNDIRALYEPAWTRRQLWDRSYSESRTPNVPALLLELLSHLNFADMRYGLDPSFRFTAARAVYKGMLKYLSARYGCDYAVQPLPVHAFKVDLVQGKAVLSWAPTEDPLEPTAMPRYYRVYTRVGDGGFDAGYEVNGTSVTLPMEAGKLYSYKITACNDGGESFPSEILCAGYPSLHARRVQVVNDFTRVAAPVWFDTPQYAGFLDDTDSGVPWGRDIHFAGSVNEFDRGRAWTDDDNPGFGACYMDQAGKPVAGNTFDFAAAHGAAILKAGYSVESSSAEAFDGLSGAFAIDMICGKQLTTRVGRGAVPDRYPVFSDSLQTALRRFTASGGHVLISGAYIGTDAWDHVYPGVPVAPEATRQFVRTVLGYEWVTNAGTRGDAVQPARGSGLPAVHYNRAWSPSVYRVESPDGIKPASAKASVLMRYGDSAHIGAATWYDGPGYKVAAFGFPLETSPEMESVIRVVLGKF